MSILVRNTNTNRNVVLEVDSTNRIGVKDTDAASKLTTISSALSGTLTVSDTTAHSKIDGINTTLGSTLTVSDSAAQAKLDTIDTSLGTINTTLGGTLTVSQGVSRTNATLTSAAVVSASAYTSSVDANAHKKIAVYGTSSLNTQQIRVYISDDDVNYYEAVDQNIYSSGSSGDYHKIISCVARYIKFQYVSGGTETTKYTLMA